MTLAFIGLCVCALLMVVALVAMVVSSEKPLPPPEPDTRDWTGAFMKDWKRR